MSDDELHGRVRAAMNAATAQHGHCVDAVADRIERDVVRPLQREHDKWAAAIAETAVRLDDAGYRGQLVDSVTRLIANLVEARSEMDQISDALRLPRDCYGEEISNAIAKLCESRFRWAEEAAEEKTQRDRLRLAWMSARRGQAFHDAALSARGETSTPEDTDG